MLKAPMTERDRQESEAYKNHLEANLKHLPPEIAQKLRKLNFYNTSYDLAEGESAKENIKAAMIELLVDFINKGYHPICIDRITGYYVTSEDQQLPRLPVFRNIYDPQRASAIVPAFHSKLNPNAAVYRPLHSAVPCQDDSNAILSAYAKRV